jgi:hypothetical protein
VKKRALVQSQAHQRHGLVAPFNLGGTAYRHRSRIPSEEHRDKVRNALVSNRQILARSIEFVRILSIRRDERIAQSLEDGLSVNVIAGVTDLTAQIENSIGILYDLVPGVADVREHLFALTAITMDLRRAENERESLKAQRDSIIITAHRRGLLDGPEIASLSGPCSDEVHLHLQEALCLGDGSVEGFLLGGGLPGLARVPFMRRGVHPGETAIRRCVEDAKSLHGPFR